LTDYYKHVSERELTGLATELREATDALTDVKLQLGGAVAYKFRFGFDESAGKVKNPTWERV
jgi:hypothetical protein